MPEWISKVEALARITLKTGIQDPSELLSDAIRDGRVATDAPKVKSQASKPDGDIFRDAVNLYAGGHTFVDLDDDADLRKVFQTVGFDAPDDRAKINLPSLLNWLSNLMEQPTSSKPSKAGAKAKYDWEEYERCIRQRVNEIGLPDMQNIEGWRSQTDVVNFVLDLASKGKEFPSERQARARVSRILGALGGN